MEHKSVSIELKDFSPGSRTAVVAHAVYNNIDLTGDISRKGMFTKSWRENPKIDFLFNHKEDQIPGNAVKMWEDDERAYTEVKFGNWTLGNDVMEMADAGVLRGVSFGYNAQKKDYITVKGKKVRELKEVYHGETSLLTVLPANPLAKVVSLTKNASGILSELKAHILVMEKFCRDTKASDETIKKVLNDLVEAKAIIEKFDTADTRVANEQPASEVENKGATDQALTILKLISI